MNWIFYLVFTLSLGFLFSPQAYAQTYKVTSSYNVRSSPKFLNTSDNILGTLSPGSTIKVLETKILRPSGVESFRIEVLDTKSKIKKSKTDEIWIRKSDAKHYVPTEGTCPECGEKAMKLSPASEQNINDLKATQQHFEKEIVMDVIQHDPGSEKTVVEKNYDTSFEQKIKNYSQSSEVAKMIKLGVKKGARSLGKCYRSVKDMMVHSGLLKKHFSSLAARYAEDDLQDFGFVNLLEKEPYASKILKPSDAPKGSILVYSSGIACRSKKGHEPDCGHIEVKLGEPGEPGYSSDYKSSDAINETSASKRFGSRYKLIGVMVKPMDNE